MGTAVGAKKKNVKWPCWHGVAWSIALSSHRQLCHASYSLDRPEHLNKEYLIFNSRRVL
jgi:hypothetical protein